MKDGAGTYLDEVLALGFCDQGLEFGCCEGVDESCLGDDEEEHLGAGEDRELISL